MIGVGSAEPLQNQFANAGGVGLSSRGFHHRADEGTDGGQVTRSHLGGHLRHRGNGGVYGGSEGLFIRHDGEPTR